MSGGSSFSTDERQVKESGAGALPSFILWPLPDLLCSHCDLDQECLYMLPPALRNEMRLAVTEDADCLQPPRLRHRQELGERAGSVAAGAFQERLRAISPFASSSILHAAPSLVPRSMSFPETFREKESSESFCFLKHSTGFKAFFPSLTPFSSLRMVLLSRLNCFFTLSYPAFNEIIKSNCAFCILIMSVIHKRAMIYSSVDQICTRSRNSLCILH